MAAVSAFRRRRFTVQQYERMVEAGVIGPDERVELLDGEVVEMPPIGPPHASRVDRCNAYLGRALGSDVIIRVQNPLRLSDVSLPEPDITVLRARDDFYVAGHPTVADVLLLVEVGDTSAGFDREVKLPLYAAGAVGEVWLLTSAPTPSRSSVIPLRGATRPWPPRTTATSSGPSPFRVCYRRRRPARLSPKSPAAPSRCQ